MNWPISTGRPTTLGEDIGQGTRQEAWFLGALGGADPAGGAAHTDQLRQRVAFALSEILVISDQNTTLSGYPAGMAYMYDILSDNAFGNYRTLLEKVTLSPAMGVYLNMMGNRRADLDNNVHPDENYGREINQLFGIGLVMLNADGTTQLSGGKPIPTYDQATITNFAHVFTGWNWKNCDEDNGVAVCVQRVYVLLHAVQHAERFPHADDSVRHDRFRCIRPIRRAITTTAPTRRTMSPASSS